MKYLPGVKYTAVVLWVYIILCGCFFVFLLSLGPAGGSAERERGVAEATGGATGGAGSSRETG